MNIDDIRKQAPQGATHYLIICGEVVYYKYPFNFLCKYWNGEHWVKGNRHTFKKPL